MGYVWKTSNTNFVLSGYNGCYTASIQWLGFVISIIYSELLIPAYHNDLPLYKYHDMAYIISILT